ncbi:HAMP domain-containing protein, partial [Pseudomonas aeruginosa]
MSAGFGSRMSLGVRLSLLFAACTAAVSLIAGLIFSRAIDEHFVELDHMAMSAKLAVFRDELRGLGSEQQMRRREAELLRELARHPDLGLRLNGPDGNLWFERLPQPAHPGLPANRELGAPLEPGNDASPRLTVILDISHHQHFLQRMRQLIWLTMSLSALATALLGAWATGASLAPLRRMREVAARVSANSLTTRLDASRMPEELRGLAGELNAMLARLEEAFQRLSAFSAD